MKGAVIELSRKRHEQRAADDNEAATAARLFDHHRRLVTIAERAAVTEEIVACGLQPTAPLDVLSIYDVGHNSMWRARLIVPRYSLIRGLNDLAVSQLSVIAEYGEAS